MLSHASQLAVMAASMCLWANSQAPPSQLKCPIRVCMACVGFRGRIITARENLWPGRPYRPLTEGLRKTGGRNNQGRITSWHRGGGTKRLYRQVRCCLLPCFRYQAKCQTTST